MNILEYWHQEGVIQIVMCDIAQAEASKGSPKRYEKASQYIFPITLDSRIQSPDYHEIKKILFPQKKKLLPNEENDIIIVFHAKNFHNILITNDGGSKRQPNGILGNRDLLFKRLHVQIMRDNEAVDLVTKKFGSATKELMPSLKKQEAIYQTGLVKI